MKRLTRIFRILLSIMFLVSTISFVACDGGDSDGNGERLDGIKLTVKEVDPEDNIKSITSKFIYDEKGTVTKRLMKAYDESESLLREATFFYVTNAKGLITEARFGSQSGDLAEKYAYDSQDRISIKTEYSEGAIDSITEYTYDASGKMNWNTITKDSNGFETDKTVFVKKEGDSVYLDELGYEDGSWKKYFHVILKVRSDGRPNKLTMYGYDDEETDIVELGDMKWNYTGGKMSKASEVVFLPTW